MPARSRYRIDKEKSYFHIYNKGVEKRIIFNDSEDYQTFLHYLRDYLTAPQERESVKREFTVNGHTFQGVPHQPKNYLNEVELLAYSLTPNHFSLLVHQITKGSLERLMRSLCTRYSMYFNKKYGRSGALFEGPYKSIHIKDEPILLYLTRYLHQTGGYTSYSEYLGTRATSWVKPKTVLSFFEKKGTKYKDFVEKYNLNQKEKDFLKGAIFESVENRPPPKLKPQRRIPEFLTISAVFLVLVTIGITNVNASTNKSPKPSPTPLVSGVSTTSPEVEDTMPKEELTPIEETPTEEVKPKITMIIIKINDGSRSVNIRQKPTLYSEKIAEANDSETFELVSKVSGWYEIKLIDGSVGFISPKYVEIEQTNN